jgi:hypothetical protein
VAVLIELWAKLRPDDPRNLEFEAAVAALHLGDDHRRLLKAAGATDLRSIAQAVKAAPDIARYNDKIRDLRRARKAERVEGPLPETVRSPISPADAAAMRRAVGEGLERERSKKPAEK